MQLSQSFKDVKMTSYEKISVVVSIINLLILVAGFGFGWKQIKSATTQLKTMQEQHSDNHEWNRKMAAQEALRQFQYSVLDGPLREKFDYLHQKQAFDLKVILNEFKTDGKMQTNLHQLLNFYEGLARGVNQGIYDEGLIKTGRKNSMIMLCMSFASYIEHRRIISPKAWSDLTHTVDKWKNEDLLPHISTPLGTSRKNQ